MTDDFAEQQPGGQPDIHDAQPDAADVERAIQEQERVQVASINLPAMGSVPEDLKLQVCQRVKVLMKRHRWSLRDLAKGLGSGTHESIISQVLRRKYDHEDSEHIRRLNAWAESTEKRTRALRPEGICDTGVVRMTRAGCDYAKSNACMVLMTGPAGIGKTNAAQVYTMEDLNSLYIRHRSTHNSPTSFLGLISESCHVPRTRSKSAMMDALVNKLRGSHRLLIIDEWHLAEKPVYETIRDLHDLCNVPIVLIGTEDVRKRVESARQRKGEVWSDQFCSRIGWVVDLTRLHDDAGNRRPLFTIDEIRAIFRSDQIRITRDGAEFLQALSCAVGLGCLRIAHRCYTMAARLARKTNEINAGHLRKAFLRQAVPDGVDDSALLMQVDESLHQIRHYAAMAG